MKAVVIDRHGGPEVLHCREVPQPVPGEGQVLIRTAAASVNFADVKLRRGRYHTPAPLPIIPGLDVAGTVAALGPGVTGLAMGQRVAALCDSGGYAEYVAVPANLVWPVPAAVDLETAAAVPAAGITAYNLLTLAGHLAPGETVLIHAAAGGVGTIAVQLARLLGAGTIIGTVSNDAKGDLPRRLGCDHVINYRRVDWPQQVREHVTAGPDLVLDSVGGEVFAQSLACLAPFGRLVTYGAAAGEPGWVNADRIHPANQAVVGYSTGTYRRLRPDALRPAGTAVLDYLAQGRLQVSIGGRYPLAGAAAAHRLLESRRSTGKILLLLAGEGH